MVNRETIEAVLSKNLERHETLAVGLNRRGRADCAYFYTLNAREQLLQVRSALQAAAGAAPGSFSAFPGMVHPYYGCPVKEDVDKDLVIRLQEDEEKYTLTFLPIAAVEYRRSFGSKIEPFLVTGKPVYTLLIEKRDGRLCLPGRAPRRDFKVVWWFNKLCRRNVMARRFFISLFQEIGKTRYIFRDIARTLQEDEFILPPLTYQELLTFHTPRDLIRHYSQIDLGIDFNKIDLNAAYFLVRLAEQISKKDWGKLREVSPQWIVRHIRPRDLYEGVSAARFVGAYYSNKLGTPLTLDTIGSMAEDYASLCRELGQETRLSFNSAARLRREHDQLVLRRNLAANAEEFERPLVPENSRFSPLEALRAEGFEYITDTRRLFEEGVRMHNCVFSYRRKIREDRCAILHWNGMDIGPYTIEVTDNGRRFQIEQMQTRFNNGYSIYDYWIVQDHLLQLGRLSNRTLEAEVQDVFGGMVEFE